RPIVRRSGVFVKTLTVCLGLVLAQSRADANIGVGIASVLPRRVASSRSELTACSGTNSDVTLSKNLKATSLLPSGGAWPRALPQRFSRTLRAFGEVPSHLTGRKP